MFQASYYCFSVFDLLTVPNFTEHGFGLARCPDGLLSAMKTAIREGYPTARFENEVEVINGNRPLFIDRPDLTKRVLNELRHYAEEWSGMPLVPYRAYGFRLYQNNSQLTMHIDKMQTHIISFILHIDSSDDAEPWPIFIEGQSNESLILSPMLNCLMFLSCSIKDFHGNTHKVILHSGDILLYESSKCWHGRPKRLNGSFYSSIFAHYYPKGDWYSKNHELEAHFAVPPIWAEPHEGPRHHNRLQMVGTSMIEPDCEHQWCRVANSITWSGPGEEGYWIAPTGEKYPFEPQAGKYDEL